MANTDPQSGKTSLRYKAWGGTDLGRKRTENQDAALIDTVNGFFMVADGMGGGVRGAEAAQTSVETVRTSLFNSMAVLHRLAHAPTRSNYRVAQQAIQQAVLSAHAKVRAASRSLGAGKVMGTTFTALIVTGRVGIVGHVGDSRIYRLRDGTLQLLSRDHSWIAERVRRGEITPEQARKMPGQNVLMQALGASARIELDVAFVTMKPGDEFLLCSDGLHRYLIEDEIVTVFKDGVNETTISRLIDCANQRGGSDNITALVVKVEAPWDSAAATQLDLGDGLFSSMRLFAGLDMTRTACYLQAGRVRSFIPGELVLVEDRPLDCVHLVLEGRATTTRQGVWMGTLTPGSFYGHETLLGPAVSPFSVSCSDEGLKIVEIPTEAFCEVMGQQPDEERLIMRNLLRESVVVNRELAVRLSESVTTGGRGAGSGTVPAAGGM